jgi:hypothetical protein
MKKSKLFGAVPALALIFGVAQIGRSAPSPSRHAQASASSAAQAMSSAAAGAKGQSADVREGTKISAALASTLDARKAKPGDKVTTRVTKNVKQHGHVVIHKGDSLLGYITQVHAGVSGKQGSSVAVAFNRLVQGKSTTQLNAVLTSILSVPGGDQGGMMPMESPMPEPVVASSGGGRGGQGGLLGGVGSTVGSTVDSTVGAAGSVAGAAGQTLGGVGGSVGAETQSSLGNSSALNLSTPVRQVHIESQSSADQSTGMNSVLSTRKGDLRLESGTRMQFRVEGGTHAQ